MHMDTQTNHPSSASAASAFSIQRVIKAFGYSLSGLNYAWQQPALRLELATALLLIMLAIFWQSPMWVILLIVALWLWVLTVEILNTAVEVCIDYISLERHPLAKKAKDLASAAVFLSLVVAILASLLLIFCWH